ncbi:MAG TPA: class I SAM-dependent rRNA methyltransferase [Firmicutes bacterium]|jgi:23S rRNA (cytosine1962-C5)-methyltransferase|nr:class I SAM-dependent rRNA methyltransferase [Candidatus Fermentithermobacillaceae bacterium]
MRPVVNLLPKVKHRVFYGHPWVFASEIGSVEGSFSPGDVVEVRDPRGRFVCLGYLNPESTITVRVLSREDREIDEGFFRERVRQAVEYRHSLFGVKYPFGQDSGGYRLVYSEGDFLPGLVVDVFAGYVSFQTLTLGIDRWKETLVDAIHEFVSPKGVYERNDAPVRRLEGLNLRAGYLGAPFDPLIEMDENGVTVMVDIQRGQKTGYFLDQSENRLVARKFLSGRSVLDAFSYSGGFGLSALVGGASGVLFMDVSEAALDLCRAAAGRNRFDVEMSFRAANVFDALREFERSGRKFGAVLLDPPAFARSRKMVESALAGYKEVNLRAMKVIEDGGILCTSSCSQHVTAQEFDNMLDEAASDARVVLRVIERRGQRADHPILAGVPETEYLKFRVCQVLKG